MLREGAIVGDCRFGPTEDAPHIATSGERFSTGGVKLDTVRELSGGPVILTTTRSFVRAAEVQIGSPLHRRIPALTHRRAEHPSFGCHGGKSLAWGGPESKGEDMHRDGAEICTFNEELRKIR